MSKQTKYDSPTVLKEDDRHHTKKKKKHGQTNPHVSTGLAFKKKKKRNRCDQFLQKAGLNIPATSTSAALSLEEG